MNSNTLWLIVLTLGWVMWLMVRIMAVTTYIKGKNGDRRKFLFLLLWPALLGFQMYFVKAWQFSDTVYLLALFSLVFGLFVDIFFYLVLKADGAKAKRWQWISGVLVFAAITGHFAMVWQPVGGLALRVPHYGKAHVWCEPLFRPTTFYFSKRVIRSPNPAKAFEDPNFGQAIFSPCSGVVQSIEEDKRFLVIAPDLAPGGQLRLGPFLSESLQVTPGSKVFSGQPLGLQGESLDIPGIQMQVSGIQAFHFSNYLAGWRWARQISSGMLQRNQVVVQNSNFKFEPASYPD